MGWGNTFGERCYVLCPARRALRSHRRFLAIGGGRMPLVRVRTYLDRKLLGEPTRPYASEVTVKAVIDRAIEPLEGIKLVDTYLERPLRAGGKAPAQAHACAPARHDGVHT